MSILRHMTYGVLALSMTGILGAYAVRDFAPAEDQKDNRFWLETKLSDDLLSGRLNVTNIAKTRALVPMPLEPSGKVERTAQLAQ